MDTKWYQIYIMSNSSGVHWVFMVCPLVPIFQHFILDPYWNTANLVLIIHLFSDARSMGMGHRDPGDWWRCGYIVLWWRLFCHFYTAALAETDAFDPIVLPRHADRWEGLCFPLLRACETQRHMSAHHSYTFNLK